MFARKYTRIYAYSLFKRTRQKPRLNWLNSKHICLFKDRKDSNIYIWNLLCTILYYVQNVEEEMESEDDVYMTFSGRKVSKGHKGYCTLYNGNSWLYILYKGSIEYVYCTRKRTDLMYYTGLTADYMYCTRETAYFMYCTGRTADFVYCTGRTADFIYCAGRTADNWEPKKIK